MHRTADKSLAILRSLRMTGKDTSGFPAFAKSESEASAELATLSGEPDPAAI